MKSEFPEYLFHFREGTSADRTIKISEAEYKARIQTRKELKKIDYEVDLEVSGNNFEDYKKKRTRGGFGYFKPLEMKTEVMLNAENDLYDIEGGSGNLVERLKSLSKTDRIIVLYGRKRFRGTIFHFDDEVVVIKTHDRKKIEFTYKQIEESKIRINAE